MNKEYVDAYDQKDFRKLKQLVEDGLIDNDLDAVVLLIENELKNMQKE